MNPLDDDPRIAAAEWERDHGRDDIVVHTQAELDAALTDQQERRIIIGGKSGVWLRVRGSASVVARGSASVEARDSASVEARGSASVEARGSTSVVARDSASVEAWGSASVVARGSARVEARDSASVEAWGSASVVARGSASVVARGSASVEARGSASVEAWDSASVEAWGSASVVARGSASVEARDSASVEAWGSASVVARGSARVVARGSASVVARDSASVEAWDSASVEARDSASVEARGSTSVVARDSASVVAGSHTAVHLHSGRATVSGGVLIDHTLVNLSDQATWCAYHGVQVTDGYVTAYKAVRDDYRSARGTEYRPGTTAACDDWADTDGCGGGLHFSPTPCAARDYDRDATRFVELRVPLAEIRPITGGGTPKAKAQSVECVREVDLHCRPLVNPIDDDPDDPRIAAAEWERDDDAEDRYDRWVER